MFAPDNCWVPWWPSKVYPIESHVEWVRQRYGTASVFDPITRWVLAGHDFIQEHIAACRLFNMAAFVSFRLNDVQNCAHAQSNSPLRLWDSVGFDKSYAENPRWRLGSDLSVVAQACQDWTIEEVRNYKFALIRELCANYDLDGIELDFVRWPHYFNQTGTTLRERRSIMGAFIASVRALLDAKIGRRRYLALRVPCDLAVCGEVGLDLAAFAGLGVDMITVSPSYFTLQASDFSAIRAAVGKMPAYLEMTNNDQGGYRPDGQATYRRTTRQQFFTTAYLGFAKGATGMSLFNFAYYRDGMSQTGHDPPYTEPPFDILPVLQNPKLIARQPQHYFNAGGAGVMVSPQLPANVHAGPHTFTLTFDLLGPDGGWVNGGRFRLKCLDTKPGVAPYTFRGSTWEVYFSNAGHTNVLLAMTSDTSEPYSGIWTQEQGAPDQRLAWIVPAKLLRNGTNTFLCKKLSGSAYLRIGYADLGVS